MASQNSIEEELLHQGRVPGITNDEAPKQSPNPSHPNCGSPSPSKFACCVNVPELALLWKLPRLASVMGTLCGLLVLEMKAERDLRG